MFCNVAPWSRLGGCPRGGVLPTDLVDGYLAPAYAVRRFTEGATRWPRRAGAAGAHAASHRGLASPRPRPRSRPAWSHGIRPLMRGQDPCNHVSTACGAAPPEADELAVGTWRGSVAPDPLCPTWTHGEPPCRRWFLG